ncbi:antitoxin MazE family protein [Methylobacillus gramineus]|uniref:antitoxin MazE family protein n=1 Tax=Methylobacillus gramineus TaxID=755169 RepID=UPI001CFFBEAC|nr:antitoxin MazE family protein [Methylobacillus gramineus]MCB5185559.1 antitoxin MazE family protein [Methylobacillus gramineus]
MATLVNDRVKKHRHALRMAGLRPVQIWVPDTRQAGFAAECRRQSQLIAKAESTNQDVSSMLDQALEDIEGWE